MLSFRTKLFENSSFNVKYFKESNTKVRFVIGGHPRKLQLEGPDLWDKGSICILAASAYTYTSVALLSRINRKRVLIDLSWYIPRLPAQRKNIGSLHNQQSYLQAGG